MFNSKFQYQLGQNHLHILIEFKHKKQFLRFNFLDKILGKHASYEPARYVNKVFDYITKEDKYPATYGVLSKKCSVNKNQKTANKKHNAYAEAINATNCQEAIRIIKKNHQRDYVLWREKIHYHLQQEFKELQLLKLKDQYNPPSSYNKNFKPTVEIQQWLNNEFEKEERAKMLMLIGPSRIGKTAFARSLGKHMFFRGQFNLDKWNDDTKYMVFDDVPWESTKSYNKQLFTAMGEIEIADKYRSKRTLVTYKPVIYISNEVPTYQTSQEKEYWDANSITVQLQANQKLYEQ